MDISDQYTYQHVSFKPWVGDRYGTSSRFGVSLLVLGWSHYLEPLNPARPDRFTIDVTYMHHVSHLFWKRVADVISGEVSGSVDSKDLWRSIAFYNYIQESVGRDASHKPTARMSREAQEPFLEVLGSLKPECIIVLGSRNWWQLPPVPICRVGPVLQARAEHLSASQRQTYWYPTGSTTEGLALHIRHPSARGPWDPADWRPLIREAIELARYSYPTKTA